MNQLQNQLRARYILQQCQAVTKAYKATKVAAASWLGRYFQR